MQLFSDSLCHLNLANSVNIGIVKGTKTQSSEKAKSNFSSIQIRHFTLFTKVLELQTESQMQRRINRKSKIKCIF